MAEDREPPPLNNEVDLFGEDNDDDDIFKSTTSEPATASSNQAALFDPVPLDEPTESKPAMLEPEPEKPAELEPEPEKEEAPPVEDTPPVSEPLVSTPVAAAVPQEPATVDDDGDDLFASPSSDLPVKKESVSAPLVSSPEPQDEAEAEEARDNFNIEITITNPMKVGDGMSAYMVYQVNTVTNIPAFKQSQFAVKRRFSDFLGLHDKLVHNHRAAGVVVPKPPEKSTVGMAKVKMAKEESGSQDFVEKRRAALERYMNRTGAHPSLRMDPYMRDFLTMDADLPKASGTSALSAAGVMRLFGRMGDAVTKLSSQITETDSWFDDKIQEIENLEIQLRKLHESSEVLVMRRHTCSQNATLLAKALAVLASSDEHTNLSQVMSKLAEVQDNLQQIIEEQADSDFFTFSELLKDYLSQISAVKDVFVERIKIHKGWKDAETNLTKKREAKVKLELANKTEKIPQASAEVKEWEDKVEKGNKDFDAISVALKKEMGTFDRKRCKDFKANLTNYLQKLMNNEEQLIKYWEAFLPEAKSIA